MTAIPDFNEADRKRVSVRLTERYGKPVPIELADCELQLGDDPSQLAACPALYWSERSAHFIMCKIEEGRYRETRMNKKS